MFERVCTILTEFTQLPISEMTMDSQLLSDLDMNSLDTVDAVVRFEEEFQTEVPDRVILELRTIGDIVRYLKDDGDNVK